MAAPLPAGTLVTVILGGTDTLQPFPRPLGDRVQEALQAQGARLEILSYDDTYGFPTNYTATVIARTTIERANAQEVLSVLAFAFYLATKGTWPAESSVTHVAGVPTGDPAPGAPPGVGGGDLMAPFRALWNGLTTLLTAAPWVIFAIVALVIVVVVMLARQAPAKLIGAFA